MDPLHLIKKERHGMQVAARQPVIMLVTAHLSPEDLHPALLENIAGRGPLPSAQPGISGTSQLSVLREFRNVVLLETDLPRS